MKWSCSCSSTTVYDEDVSMLMGEIYWPQSQDCLHMYSRVCASVCVCVSQEPAEHALLTTLTVTEWVFDCMCTYKQMKAVHVAVETVAPCSPSRLAMCSIKSPPPTTTPSPSSSSSSRIDTLLRPDFWMTLIADITVTLWHLKSLLKSTEPVSLAGTLHKLQ